MHDVIANRRRWEKLGSRSSDGCCWDANHGYIVIQIADIENRSVVLAREFSTIHPMSSTRSRLSLAPTCDGEDGFFGGLASVLNEQDQGPRPSVFKSEPNSPHDVLITMKRLNMQGTVPADIERPLEIIQSVLPDTNQAEESDSQDEE
jgi:hypothetical protein